MAENKNCYLICYDIRDPKRWRKAYKLLEGYGERIQYSIFRSWLNMRSREKLRWELEKILTTVMCSNGREQKLLPHLLRHP